MYLFDRVQKYVKEQVLQVVAVIFKRGTLDTPQAGRTSLLSDVTQLMSNKERNLVNFHSCCSRKYKLVLVYRPVGDFLLEVLHCQHFQANMLNSIIA